MGNSGGILTMWHKDIFKCVKKIVGNMYIGVIGDFYNTTNINPILVIIFNVYSCYEFNEEVRLWEEPVNIKLGEVCKQWCVLGDINVMRKSSEKKGLNFRGSTATREVQGFNSFIKSAELLDVPLIGGRYTWYKDNDTTKSRIDRILIS